VSNFNYNSPRRWPKLDERVHTVDGDVGVVRAVFREGAAFVFVVRWRHRDTQFYYEAHTKVSWKLGIVRPGPYRKVVSFVK
jgi:hypothetical protein